MAYGSILGQTANTYSKEQIMASNIPALFGLGSDAVPSDVLEKLSGSAFAKTYATEIAPLSEIEEGQTVWFIEEGGPAEYYIAKHNYESSLNGTGKTLVQRKEPPEKRQWNTSLDSAFSSSAILTYLNTVFKAKLSKDVQDAIVPVSFYSAVGNGDDTVSVISSSIFLASATELGLDSATRYNVEGTTFPAADTIRSFTRNADVGFFCWTRSPTKSRTSNTNAIVSHYNSNTINWFAVTDEYPFRPCFALPSDFIAFKSTPISGLYDISNNLITSSIKAMIVRYIGTGTYGESNPNSLTAEFPISLAIMLSTETETIAGYGDSNQTRWIMASMCLDVDSFTAHTGFFVRKGATPIGYGKISADRKTISWYVDETDGNAEAQFNAEDTTYYCLLLGIA